MEDIDPDDPLPAPSLQRTESPSLKRAESAPPASIVEVDLVADEEKESAPKRQKSLMDFQGFTRSGSTSASQPSWGHAKDVTCLVCEIRIRSMKHGFDI